MKTLKKISGDARSVWAERKRPILSALKYGMHPSAMSVFKSDEASLDTSILSTGVIARCPVGITYPCVACEIIEKSVEKATGSSLAIGTEYYAVNSWEENKIGFYGQKLKAVDPFIDTIVGHLLVAIEPPRLYSTAALPNHTCINVTEL